MPEPNTFPEFSTAYSRYGPPVVAKCQRLLGRTAAAEDIAQEAFVRLWQSGPRLSHTCTPATLLAWLYVTSTRLGIDALRRNRWQLATDSDAVTACSASAQNCVEARSLVAAFCSRVPALELATCLATAAAWWFVVQSVPEPYVGTKGAPTAQFLLQRAKQLHVWRGRKPLHPKDVLALHVASGTTVVETLSGEAATRVRLPAGQYVMRQVGPKRVVSKRVALGQGADGARRAGTTAFERPTPCRQARRQPNYRCSISQHAAGRYVGMGHGSRLCHVAQFSDRRSRGCGCPSAK